jgi:hypothetical protein
MPELPAIIPGMIDYSVRCDLIRAVAEQRWALVKQRIAGSFFLRSPRFSLIVCATLLLLSAACMGWSFYLAYHEVGEVYVMVPALSGMLFAAFATVLAKQRGLVF